MQWMISELTGLAFIAVAFGYMYASRLILNKMAGSGGAFAIEKEKNLAAAFRRSGFYIAIGIGMFGAVSGPSAGLGNDLVALVVDGAVLTGFLLVARVINDYLVLHGIDNNDAIKNGNIAVGLVEFCGYLATGLIAWASFSGRGGGLLSAIVFFALGQLVLVVVTALYEKFTKTVMLEEIRRGNIAAAAMTGGQMLAIGIILFGSITGDFTSWGKDIAAFARDAGVGIVLLFLLELLVDHVFLPNSRFEEQIVAQNTAAIVLGSSIRVGLAVMLVGAVVA